MFLGKGVTQAVENINDEIADELVGLDGTRSTRSSTADDRTRRDAEQEALVPMPSWVSRWPWPRPPLQYTEQPLFRYLGGAAARSASRADDEHRQRRRARRQLGRRPGVHGHAAGLRSRFSDASAVRRGSLPQPQEGALQAKKLNTAVGDEGGFAPDLGSNAGSPGPDHGSDRARLATRPASKFGSPWTWRPPSCTTRTRATYTIDGKEIDSAGMVDLLTSWVEKYPDLLD